MSVLKLPPTMNWPVRVSFTFTRMSLNDAVHSFGNTSTFGGSSASKMPSRASRISGVVDPVVRENLPRSERQLVVDHAVPW